jgi:hypothetical protein
MMTMTMTMTMTIIGRAIVAIGCVLAATAASAQETLREAVGVLMTNQAVQTGSVERDRAAADEARDTIARALLINLTSAPIATSSGGFLYRLNPELGTVERATESFGTLFVERALTAGQGSTLFGVMVSSASYTRLNGYDLEDGSLVTVANRFRDEAQPFDTESLSMNLNTRTLNIFASVGVTDRFDVGVVVPLARISFDGERLNEYRGTPFVQAIVTGTASGLADIALRAKYAVVSTPAGGVAAAGEIRLPTGDEENLLGTGETSWRLLGVASLEQGPLSVHGNGGIVRGGIANETILSGAFSVAIHPRVTGTMEFLRRRVSDLRGFVLASAPHPLYAGVDTLRVVADPTQTGTTLVTAVSGVKWNVSDTLVIGGHLLWSMKDRGLTAPLTPTISVEYAVR